LVSQQAASKFLKRGHSLRQCRFEGLGAAKPALRLRISVFAFQGVSAEAWRPGGPTALGGIGAEFELARQQPARAAMVLKDHDQIKAFDAAL
jgi:hypothetical protein